jgi:hypothetical protein
MCTRVAVLLLFSALALPASSGPVILEVSSTRVVLQNGLVHSEFDLTHPQLDVLAAYTAASTLGTNVLAAGQDSQGLYRKGIVLERNDRTSTGAFATFASSAGSAHAVNVSVVENSTLKAVVDLAGVADDGTGKYTLVVSTWRLSLAAADRHVTLDLSARPTKSAKVASVRLAAYLATNAVYGLFQRGGIGMMNLNAATSFVASDHVRRFYSLGGGKGCFEATVNTAAYDNKLTLLNSPNDAFSHSGMHVEMVGNYPSKDGWGSLSWDKATDVQLSGAESWGIQVLLWPNSKDFPISTVAEPSPTTNYSHTWAQYSAAYATAAGCLVSYDLSTPGLIAPSLAIPGHQYGDGYNFFDPDSFLETTTLLYSGDAVLESEARKVIETSMRSIKQDTGQIAHHFQGSSPTYVAISGATQTGPNMFWILASLNYVKCTGDYAWLSAHSASIEKALSFLVGLVDNSVGMLKAPGPLWIDVFKRWDFTSDSNAMMKHLLEVVADMETFLGQTSQATAHLQLAQKIKDAMNAKLWHTANNDHYITQLSADGSTRDLVDYDSNLLAVAYGIAPADRAASIIKRVDSGPCTHGRATYVSEVYYDANNCYNGNTGDSATTMGRIAWADAHARKKMGDAQTFEKVLFDPLLRDLQAKTWLTERYNCRGQPIRTPYYYEYPGVVSIMIREVGYGIDVGLTYVTIDPLAWFDWTYSAGPMTITFSNTHVVVSGVRGDGVKHFKISHLKASTTYSTSGNAGAPASVTTDASGVALFDAKIGAAVSLELKL